MRSIASKKAGWPKSHPVHSPENRIGQAWKQTNAKACSIETHKEIDIPITHFICHCNAIVRIDRHGYAACVACGEIYNDSHEVVIVPRRSKITTRSFIYNAFHKVK
jgi:hypothetical protein